MISTFLPSFFIILTIFRLCNEKYDSSHYSTGFCEGMQFVTANTVEEGLLQLLQPHAADSEICQALLQRQRDYAAHKIAREEARLAELAAKRAAAVISDNAAALAAIESAEKRRAQRLRDELIRIEELRRERERALRHEVARGGRVAEERAKRLAEGQRVKEIRERKSEARLRARQEKEARRLANLASFSPSSSSSSPASSSSSRSVGHRCRRPHTRVVIFSPQSR